MKSLNKLLSIIIMMLMLIFAACSDDDDDPTGPGNQGDAPEFGMKRVEVPSAMAQSNDPHARMGAAYVSMINGINMAFMTPPSGSLAKVTDDPWVYTFEADGFIVTTTAWEDGDKYYWEIVFNGTDGVYTFLDWKAMEAWQYIDGHAGEFMAYIEETTQLGAKWSWTENSDGSITYQFNDYTSSELLEVIIYPDGSGVLSIYDNGFLVMRISWAADGSGEWWEYNTDGTVADSGRWP
jgi:hypothetical protein